MSEADLMLAPRGSALDGDAVLDRMMARLEAIIGEPQLTAEGLVEITAIFNNVSYLFLYLEANDDTATFQRLLPKRDAFYRNQELDKRILDRITALRFDDPSVERSRQSYVEQLSNKLVESAAEEGELDRLRREVVAMEGAVAEAQTRHLNELGVVSSHAHPSVAHYQLISRAQKATTREKWFKLWTSAGLRERARSVTLVDEIFEARRQHALAHGAQTPLALYRSAVWAKK